MLKKIIHGLVFAVFSLFLSALLFEIFCLSLLAHPFLLRGVPRKVADHIGFLYINFARHNIQTEPGAVRYHPELGYELIPGKWVFSNSEFSHEFSINRACMRDDEESLAAPEVIVAGDSQAVGWGVAQDETFAQLIEQKSGLKVLNAAVPSYGTVREMMILDRVDTSRLKYLIIQYCDNDYWENKTFFLNHNRLEIHTETEWKAALEEFRRETKYYFGQYLRESWKRMVHAARIPDTSQFSGKTGQDEGWLFVNALINAGRSNLSRAQVLVVEINSANRNDKEFISNLAVTLQARPFPSAISGMKILDSSAYLSAGDYYRLDDHLNAQGHRRLAEMLLKNMG